MKRQNLSLSFIAVFKLDSFGFYTTAAYYYNIPVGAAKCIEQQITVSDAIADKTLKSDRNKLPNYHPELQRFEHRAFQGY